MATVELSEYLVRVDDKYTFYGVLSEFYDKIFFRCNDKTRSSYNSEYNRLILPELANRIMEQCEQDDYEDAIQKIIDKGYSPATVQHYRYLIRTVVRCAVEQAICEDVLFGTIFSLSPDEKTEVTKSKEFVRNRKSLKIQEEILLFQELMIDPEQEGEHMGLALMYALGLRNNEACGLKFGAIRPMESHPECYCAWMYETTMGDTNELKASGKSRNAPRALPIPQKLLNLIMKRRKLLQKMIDAGIIQLQAGQKTVDDLPIACQKFDYTEHCSSRRLTTAGRLLLRAIQVSEEEVAYIDRELQSEKRRIEMGIIEKDPTAYLLRRNLGTHLHILGLTESEIQYYMGHDIEDAYAIRNDFTNEERLYLIYQKISNRPLFQDAYPHQEIMTLSNDAPSLQCENVPAAEICVKTDRNAVALLQITAVEPKDEISVCIRPEGQNQGQGTLTVLPAMKQGTPRTVNIISQYQKAYQSDPKREE